METSDLQPPAASPSPGAPVETDDGAAHAAAWRSRTGSGVVPGGGSASPRPSSPSGVLVGAAAAFARRDDSTATNVTAPSSTAPTGVKGATAQQPKHRALSVDGPDAALDRRATPSPGSLGPSLGELTAATGVVAPRFDSRVSTGLTSPSFFDWPEHATEEMAKRDPEAVVFIIGTNDANAMPDLATAHDCAGDHRAVRGEGRADAADLHRRRTTGPSTGSRRRR